MNLKLIAVEHKSLAFPNQLTVELAADVAVEGGSFNTVVFHVAVQRPVEELFTLSLREIESLAIEAARKMASEIK